MEAIAPIGPAAATVIAVSSGVAALLPLRPTRIAQATSNATMARCAIASAGQPIRPGM